MEDFEDYLKFFLIGVLPFQMIGFFVCLHRIRAQKRKANFFGIILPLLTFFIAATCGTLIFASIPSNEHAMFSNGLTAIFLAILIIPIGATANLFCALFIPLLANYVASFGTKKI